VSEYLVHPIGIVRSSLRRREDAPCQEREGAPEALLVLEPRYADALHRVEPGDQLVLLTWLHQADRTVLQVHPRDDPSNPVTGVFATRSSDRPNPVGLHRVTVLAIEAPATLRVNALEAIDGTPIVDLKIAI
jgi:tRNA-Thr(GGU) m(6)t(6)A37 methyltransferase TsaA